MEGNKCGNVLWYLYWRTHPHVYIDNIYIYIYIYIYSVRLNHQPQSPTYFNSPPLPTIPLQRHSYLTAPLNRDQQTPLHATTPLNHHQRKTAAHGPPSRELKAPTRNAEHISQRTRQLKKAVLTERQHNVFSIMFLLHMHWYPSVIF